MTPRPKNTPSEAERQATIHELLQEQMRLAIQHTFITVLEEEVNGFIQAALYQRTPQRQGYRNGYYERDLVTTSGEIEDLPVPRTRNGFRTQLFERYQRCQEELDEAVAPEITLKQFRQIPRLVAGSERYGGCRDTPLTRLFHPHEGHSPGLIACHARFFARKIPFLASFSLCTTGQAG